MKRVIGNFRASFLERWVSRFGRETFVFVFFLVVLAGCNRLDQTAPGTPSKTPFSCVQAGSVQTYQVDSFGEIGLYLPPCYDPAGPLKYPVLYLLPGFGGTHMEWLDTGVAPLTDRLIQSGEIHPFLIVTTDNTYDSIQPEDIVRVLIPYIEARYHVNPNRTYRAIAGGSLGGAAAYLLTFQHPDLFSSAGIFGNGLITGQEAQLGDWLANIPKGLKPRVFLNSGEQDTFMLQQAKALIPILDKYGIEHQQIFSAGGHSTRYWLSNFPDYYRWLAKDWEQ